VEDQGFQEPNDLEITAYSGAELGITEQLIEMGQLHLSGTTPGQWNVFGMNGVPHGKSRHVYSYSGEMPSAEQIREYYPFRCVSLGFF
jgi:hypothetical protein